MRQHARLLIGLAIVAAALSAAAILHGDPEAALSAAGVPAGGSGVGGATISNLHEFTTVK